MANIKAMTFQQYIDNIEAKTGKSAADIRGQAEAAGLLKPDLSATQFVNWLKQELDLGHGHSMALWKLFGDNGWISPKQTKLK